MEIKLQPERQAKSDSKILTTFRYVTPAVQYRETNPAEERAVPDFMADSSL